MESIDQNQLAAALENTLFKKALGGDLPSLRFLLTQLAPEKYNKQKIAVSTDENCMRMKMLYARKLAELTVAISQDNTEAMLCVFKELGYGDRELEVFKADPMAFFRKIS